MGLVQQRLKNKAMAEKRNKELLQLREKNSAEIEHLKALNELEIAKANALAKVEIDKFKLMIDAIGPSTIAEIARAGPEMQAKLLSGLGIQSTIFTDGSSPINLFQTANGLIGGS